jgi:hypothetical protein
MHYGSFYFCESNFPELYTSEVAASGEQLFPAA